MTEDAVSRPKTIVGVFVHRNDLERALAQLTEAGFREEQIGVTMRGLSLEENRNASDEPVLQDAVRSILSVHFDGRQAEAEAILRGCGAAEIQWTNSLTASMAGTTDEIIEGEA